MPANTYPVADEAALLAKAAELSKAIDTPCVISLSGELGAGKTTFARAFIQALGYSGAVKSPTYTLLETYQAGGLEIAHFDLYRLEDPEELHALAYRDVMASADVVLVEWAEKGGSLMPDAHYVVDIEYAAPGRIIHLSTLD